jgi:hypothetical protein
MTNEDVIDIREQENALFFEWKKKYATSSFIEDGCPQPAIYCNEQRKVVFVLKDGNMGECDPGDTYDQRIELENHPNPWWSTIAVWCHFLRHPNASWSDSKKIADPISIQNELSHHCIVQLKKTWGGGSVSNDDLLNSVRNDREEIIAQLRIYQPNFIVACGNGEQLGTIFGCNSQNRQETSSGVGYWKIQLNDDNCFLIDYCHPSIRVGTKVKGLIAKGLVSALHEIELIGQ